ncbi:MAG: ABC transporter substrate-binding protein [Rhodospirillales bacterium]|nr:ABC transporter substrate-binding protein [Rhodospirillales bacterium]
MPSLTPIELIAFPGAPNLPIFAAKELGFFEKAGVEINLTTTPNSVYQVENLVAGKFNIAGTSIDNIVAYQEGQGAVKLDTKPDLFVFMGATQIELSLIVAPEIKTFEDLKGRSIALDALSTGFAFVLYRMFENANLSADDYTMVPVGATPERWASVQSGEHAGTLTIEPFTSMARAKGFNVLESSLKTVEHYQGGIFAASRRWAEENSETLCGFISGYLDGLDWALDPKNRVEAAETLLRNMPAIKPETVERVLDKVLSEKTGLTPLARLDRKGIETVLELRTQYGNADNPLTDPEKYLDLSYYEKVIGDR